MCIPKFLIGAMGPELSDYETRVAVFYTQTDETGNLHSLMRTSDRIPYRNRGPELSAYETRVAVSYSKPIKLVVETRVHECSNSMEAFPIAASWEGRALT